MISDSDTTSHMTFYLELESRKAFFMVPITFEDDSYVQSDYQTMREVKMLTFHDLVKLNLPDRSVAVLIAAMSLLSEPFFIKKRWCSVYARVWHLI